MFDHVETASNVESWYTGDGAKHGDKYIDDYDTLIEWWQKGSDDDTDRVFLLNEGSQNLSRKGSDQQKEAKLSKMLKLARKHGGHLVIIGHDGKDVGLEIRALSTAVVHKENKTEATFYHDVSDRQGEGEIMSLSGIPPTSMSYDTEDVSHFDMCMDDGDESEGMTAQEREDAIREYARQKVALLELTTDLN